MSERLISQVYIGSIMLSGIIVMSGLNIPLPLAIILFLLAIGFIGIPHGALDFFLAKRLIYQPTLQWQLGFLGVYSLVAVLSVFIWLYYPSVGLSSFLIISIYHFSSDWIEKVSRRLSIVLSTIVLSGPAVIYGEKLQQIFVYLLISPENAMVIVQVLKVSAFTSVCMLTLLLKEYSQLVKDSPWFSVESILLILSAFLLPPLVHFTLYFCLLHSIKHWMAVSKKTGLNTKKLLGISFPIVATTFVLALFFWLILSPSILEQGIYKMVFIGLFGLTVAHMLVIHLWNRQSVVSETRL